MQNAFVWVGQFASEKDFKKYANHSAAKCPFLADFPIGAIGTYLETFRSPKEPLRDAMIRLYYSAGYLDEVLKKLKQKNLTDDVNAVKVVVVRKSGLKDMNTKDWPKKGVPLTFLGSFEYGNDVPLRHPECRDEKGLEQEGWASIWIGTVPDVAAADAYMEEDFDEDTDEDAPMSAFGRDWKLSYDHDFLYHEAAAKPQAVANLLDGWNGAELFAKPAAAAAKSAGIDKGNMIVIAYDLDYSVKPPFYTLDDAGYWRHKGKPKATSPLKFVGAFRYKDE